MPPVDDRARGAEPTPGAAGRQRFYKSLDDLEGTPEFQRFVEREFPSLLPDVLDETSRRGFVKLMGASAALAGLAGCRWPEENVLPFARRPEGRIPGVPVEYATSMEILGVGMGLLVESFDGRPIKVEGNPDHPGSLGATGSWHQASVLDLYDPDRSRRAVRSEGGMGFPESVSAFDAALVDRFAPLLAARGRGVAFLSEASESPSVARLRARLRSRMPESRWYEHEAFSLDAEREGTRLVFGAPYHTQLHLSRVEVILCLDADPLLLHPNAVRHAHDFAKGRRANAFKMSRLYAVEGTHSLTGSNADHRLAMPASNVAGFAKHLARTLSKKGLVAPLEGIVSASISYEPDEAAKKFAEALAEDLLAHRGHGAIVAGPSQPPELHALVTVLNRALGNAGKRVTYTEASDPERPTHARALSDLTASMAAGRVEALVILGGNPAFDAPADVPFADALSNVPFSVHLSPHVDETSSLVSWHVPRAHTLESWGDTRAWDGTIAMTQPLIQPLYGGRTPIELLATILGEESAKGYDIVRATIGQIPGAGPFERRWRRALHEGVIGGTTHLEKVPTFRDAGLRRVRDFDPDPLGAGDMELVLTPDASVLDGRFANNGWLQELPDPMTTVAWDNVAIVGYETARSLGIAPGDRLTLEVGGRSLETAAYVMPGQAERSVALAFGYGRAKAGRVGDRVGFDAFQLRSSADPWIQRGLRVSKPGGTYLLAITQDHHTIDRVGSEGRDRRLTELYRQAELPDYEAHPEFAKHVTHHPPLESLFTEWEYEGRAWGMTIDLSVCTGCRACMVACQAENNIPVVGKEQVEKGREMHWIRIDRYFVGDPKSPSTAHQPVTCQHCQNAPCEQVCPVAATVHDAEGLNLMVYNRCVGTRYCLNNCPYKVRRFNWFNFQKHTPETKKMVHNPDVTVRSRGVMEKCTFCIQRIKAVTQRADNENRPVRDGEIVTACAQSCPTDAIVFGDLNDTSSEVHRLQRHDRAYAMLSELNVKPRNRYLAKISNARADLGHWGGAVYDRTRGGHGNRKSPGSGGEADDHSGGGHS